MDETLSRDRAALLAHIVGLEVELARLREGANSDKRAHDALGTTLTALQESHFVSSIAAATNRREIVAGWAALEVSESARILLEKTLEAQQQTNARVRALVRLATDVVYRMSSDWSEMRLLQGGAFIKDTPEPSHDWLERYIYPADQPAVKAAIAQAIATKSNFELEHRVLRIDGTLGWTFSQAIPLLNAEGEITEWLGAARDVTEHRRSQDKLVGQKRILQMVATGAPLHDTLAALINLIESQEPGLRCSLLVITEDGQHLRCICGPSFPESYHAAFASVPIGPPYIGTCGAALSECSTVSVPDVAADARFAPSWREMLLAHDVRAMRSTPVFNSGGHAIASFAFYYDRPRDPDSADPELITLATSLAAIILEHEQDDRALAEGEAYWRGIFERLHEGFVVGEIVRDASGKGIDWRFVEMNAAWETLTGLSREAARGRTITEVVPGIEPVWIDAFLRVVETGDPANVVHRAEALGSWYQTHTFRLTSERFAVVFLNTTERTKAEMALRESEARFRAAVQAVSGVLWTNSADGKMAGEQPGWAALTGQSFEQYQGYGWANAVHPEDVQTSLDAWNAAVAERKIFVFEHRLRCADGKWRHFAIRAIPVAQTDGIIHEWVGVHTDITAQREAEVVLSRDRAELERLVEERTAALLREVEERRKAEEALRQGEKMQAIGQLTGGIAHDFNNIIQVVASGATLLRQPRLTEDRRGVILDELTKATKSAKQLTGHLLAFARKQSLKPQVFDANACLNGMSEMLRHTLGSRIQVETDFVADPWPVFADPNQLEIALLNLAVNARDAMAAGGTLTFQTRNVRLEATSERSAGEYVGLAVKDTGEGIPRSMLTRVFEPFFTTKSADKGTGLGLAQAHGFAKQSGGDIAIESTLGKGTTITLHLPRSYGRAEQAPIPSPARDGAGSAMRRAAGKTVLVVDDNANVAAFACSMLEGLGYSTRQASNAAEALRLMEEGKLADALFTDVVMPGEMDGAQLASVLRQRHPRLAVVLATGYSQTLIESQGRSLGEVLHKPYSLDQLAAALERAFALGDAATHDAAAGKRAQEND